MTRINPHHYTVQQAARAAQMQRDYPHAQLVTVAIRGDGARLTPKPNEVIYVMSTGGRWGRSSEVRLGSAVRETERQRADAAAIASARQRHVATWVEACARMPIMLSPMELALGRLSLYESHVRSTTCGSYYGGSPLTLGLLNQPLDVAGVRAYAARARDSYTRMGDEQGRTLTEEVITACALDGATCRS